MTNESAQAPIRVIDITDAAGRLIAPDWLTKAETVHRQLRADLPIDYAAKMSRVFSQGGRMSVAASGNEVTGVSVYRIFENTVFGIQMYVDDLVTDEAKRSVGVGKAIMDHLQQIAKTAGCQKFTLDSGTARQQAHKFYFREQMVIAAFHFVKSLR